MSKIKSFLEKLKKEEEVDADPTGTSTKRISNVPVIIMFIIGVLVIFSLLYALAARKRENVGKVAEQQSTTADNSNTDEFIGDVMKKAKKPVVVEKMVEEEVEVYVDKNGKIIKNPKTYRGKKFKKTIKRMIPATKAAAPKPKHDYIVGNLLPQAETDDTMSEFERKKLEMEQEMQLRALSSQTKLNKKKVVASGASSGSLPRGKTLYPVIPTPSIAGLMPTTNDDLDAKASKFLSGAKPFTGYLKAKKVKPISKYEIKAGWIIPATLITGINGELPGQILAMVNQNVYDTATGEYLLIPQGTKAIGSYSSNIVYGQKRVLVGWNRLIFPDGSTLDLGTMQGTDTAGMSGFKDKVNNHYLRIFGSAILLSAITAGISLTDSGTSGERETAKDKAISQAIEQMGNVASNMIQKNMNLSPTLTIRAGYKFNIFVNKDMVLSPMEVER